MQHYDNSETMKDNDNIRVLIYPAGKVATLVVIGTDCTGICKSKTKPLMFNTSYCFCYQNTVYITCNMNAFFSFDLLISLEMPVPSQGHYGFHSFPIVD